MNKAIIIGMLVLLLPVLSPAQNLEKMQKKAQKTFYQEDFFQALVEYNEIIKLDPKNRLVKYRLVICSLLTDYRHESVQKILDYRKTQGRKDKFYNYWLGRIYYEQSNFKKAIHTWNSFTNSDKYYSKEIREEVIMFMKLAEEANRQYSHPKNYEIEQLSDKINSPFNELSPVYFKEQDELLFLSDKNSEILSDNFMIYHAYREEGTWSSPSPVEHLGKFSVEDANIEVVGEGGKLYFYKAHSAKKGDLYYSIEQGAHDWESPHVAENGLSTAKLESHFFINNTENRILFAHRKSGKPYDLDLYESIKDASNGKWGKPHSLGLEVNSPMDEDYPFLTHDGKTLYFSSKGFNSLGKYDVYRSTLDETTGIWSDPESLKYPTNSTDNDIQFKMDENTNSGYFVSDRIDSYGEYDIFFFHESAKVLLSGQVVDGSGNPVSHAQIQFFSSRETGLVVKTMTDEDGEYNVRVGNDDDVRIDIYFHDDLVHSHMMRTPHAAGAMVSMTLDFDIKQKKKKPETMPTEHVDPQFVEVEDIGSKFRESKKAKLTNIYFEFDKADLSSENYVRLEGLLTSLTDYPNLQLEIAGHTDNVGESEVNMRLSQQRAEAVLNYLVSKGIDKSRLLAKGYGDTQALATNDDEKEGRELNRRIEVVVIE
ncbi:MAG: OmpA family protein [Reichenbachiella sp.]